MGGRELTGCFKCRIVLTATKAKRWDVDCVKVQTGCNQRVRFAERRPTVWLYQVDVKVQIQHLCTHNQTGTGTEAKGDGSDYHVPRLDKIGTA